MQKEEIQDTDKRAKILYDLFCRMLVDNKGDAMDALKVAINIIINIAEQSRWKIEDLNELNQIIMDELFQKDNTCGS